jgi:hypothetical protein
MRVESDKPTKQGGFLHKLGEPLPLPPPPSRKRKAPPPDFTKLWVDALEDTRPEWLVDHAEELGVAAAALVALGAAWYAPAKAWAFPMWQGDVCCGIRLRATDGRKWAVDGSKAGIFVADVEGDTLMVCEGPTDTAAALTLGYAAVGRPSCLGQEDLVKAYARAFRNIVIMADNDAPKADGRLPGQEGAERLAKALGRPCRMVKPMQKDIRAWLRAGATKTVVDCIIKNSPWRNLA